jgi:nitrogen fixation/metabolism regulation signal transduction histidine kinase
MINRCKLGSLNVIPYLLVWAILTAAITFTTIEKLWIYLAIATCLWIFMFHKLYSIYRKNLKKVAFMFDAIDNADYAFKYATENASSDDLLVNKSLNRITQILLQARSEAQQREKYYELIINSVNTGIIVVDDKGNVYQTNKEALRLLGLTVFTHIAQLQFVDDGLMKLIQDIKPGEKHQVSFSNERRIVHLSIRASSTKIKGLDVKILAINDINSELDENELDSWIRLTRVLTHEIMNSITPITSLSETLLSKLPKEKNNSEIRNGLEVIRKTGNSLIDFVENYRKFTHLPSPTPSLFYVNDFAERMKELALHQISSTNISISIDVQPSDLIVYADENLITRVVLNLLKNAMQAIGTKQTNGSIQIKSYCNTEEAVFIEVTNNGPIIPPEEMKHIFVPFYTTKSNGNGIGLSIAKQVMRLSGGTLTLQSDKQSHLTTFSLMFP